MIGIGSEVGKPGIDIEVTGIGRIGEIDGLCVPLMGEAVLVTE